MKFQSWPEQTLYSKTYYRDNPIAKRFVKILFHRKTLKELSNYCKEKIKLLHQRPIQLKKPIFS